MSLQEQTMTTQAKGPTVGKAAAQCARSLGIGLAVVVGTPVLAIGASNLIGIAWTAWQALLTNQWTNVWPATWTVWICALLAAWCACIAYKLRHGNICMWFAAACAALILFGVLPANCAVWATIEGWKVEDTPLLDRVAAASACIFAVVGFLAPIVSIVWGFGKVAELTE